MRIDRASSLGPEGEEMVIFVEEGDDVDEIIEEARENGLNYFEGDEEIEMFKVVFADDPDRCIVEFTEDALRRTIEERQ